jgi:hypothetical protein
MAAKVGPLAARSPYQPPNKPSRSIEARPHAQLPQGSSPASKIRYQKPSTVPPYVTNLVNVSTGS